MEYYNIEQIVRIRVYEDTKSDNWDYLPQKSLGKLYFFINYPIWKLNQKSPLNKQTFVFDTKYHTLPYVKEHLQPEEYIDKETQQVMEYPKVILSLTNGTSTVMHFKSYQTALDYANKLASKSEHFIQINKI